VLSREKVHWDAWEVKCDAPVIVGGDIKPFSRDTTLD